MANMGYSVIQYDASIQKASYNHPNITFHKYFVGINNSDDTISLERIIEQNALDENAYNIMQTDIEDAEWDILEHIDLDVIARYFSQIIFEFHNCNPNDSNLTNRRLAVLESLNKYYTPIHTHFNNYGNVFYSNGLFLSAAIEVSYLRNDLIPNDSIYKTGLGNIFGLDSPNARGYADVPIIFTS